MTQQCVRWSTLLGAVTMAVTLTATPALSQGGTQTLTGRVEGHVTDSVGKPIANATVLVVGSAISNTTNATGYYFLNNVPVQSTTMRAVYPGYKPFEVTGIRIIAGQTVTQDFTLQRAPTTTSTIEVVAPKNALVPRDQVTSRQTIGIATNAFEDAFITTGASRGRVDQQATYIDGVPGGGGRGGGRCAVPQDCTGNTESYDRIVDNPFLAALGNPLSTFSIDVDRASYANVRRFITSGVRPPKDAVRIEEMLNYFPYDLPAPTARSEYPFTVVSEVVAAPWNSQHRLVRIALQGRRVETADLPPSNLVFLIDVSGSMSAANKLPLVKASLAMLVEQLRAQDHVALAVYAGNAGLVLPSTSGENKGKILEAIDRLSAGGSTAGGAGLRLAYNVARENFITGGNNRVILSTDGDFNVGQSSDAEMERLIEEERDHGVSLTVLGFGMGNYKDSKMEKLADKGNGNYAYIDSPMEARKTLVHEMGGTLLTIAKDVKLQVEFNPAVVKSYRLIGYENRMLRTEDFKDDRKDAGDIGAGHSVTALYEIVPAGTRDNAVDPAVPELRYQQVAMTTRTSHSDELMFVKLRYKEPGSESSKEFSHTIPNQLRTPSTEMTFAAAVAEFGMLLRDSEFKGDASAEDVLALAQRSLGPDLEGYRAGFVSLVQAWQRLPKSSVTRE